MDEALGRPGLVFQRLAVQRMPGIPSPGFEMNKLGPGINVVYGPNASGKTTTAASIRALLWPGTAPGQAALDADVLIGPELRRFSIHSGDARYDGDPPSVVSPDQSDRYQLGLHDLMAADGAGYARQVIAEALGGYRLDDAERELGYHDRPASLRSTSEFRAWQAARGQVETAKRSQIRVMQAKERLDRARQELAEAELAAAWHDLLQAVIRYLEDQNRLTSAENALASFPEPVRQMDQAFEVRLSHLKQQRDEARHRLKELAGSARLAVAQLRSTGLGGDPVQQADLDRLDDLISQLQHCEEQIASAEDALPGARARRDHAASRLGPHVDQKALRRVDLDRLYAASQFVRSAADVAAKLRAREELRDVLGSAAEAGPDPTEAIRLLRMWLRSARSGVPLRTTWFSMAGGVLIGFGLALGVLVHPAWVALGAAGGLVVWASLSLGRRDLQADIAAHFRTTGMPEPASWTEEDVSRRIEELERTLADIRMDARRREVERRYAGLDAQAEDVRRQAVELAGALGVEPEQDADGFYAAWLAQYAELARSWVEADAECCQMQAELDAAWARRTEALAEIGRILGQYGAGPAQTAESARQALRSLKDREAQRRQACSELEQCRRERRKQWREWRERQRQVAESYRALGLEPEDEAGLARICEQRNEWVKAQRTVDELRAVASDALNRLLEFSVPDQGNPAMRRWLSALHLHCEHGAPAPAPLDVADLKAEAGRMAQRADRAGDLQKEIGSLNQQIEDATQDRSLEGAIADLDAAEDALCKRASDALRRKIGWRILRAVEQETQDRGLPSVFHRARDYLHTFTRGRYRLELDHASCAFRVWDAVDEVRRSMNQLSTGTRVQLLLAVRLAFIECQEPGPMLPLLLDETLADSDEQRMQGAIDALAEVAKSGRQVFYFTCRSEEVERWKRAEVSGIPVNIVDLRRLRDAAGPELVAVELPEMLVPEPNGLSHEEYGRRLNVRGFMPGNGIGDVHLWHFVMDVEYLHHLLVLGLERWGQVEDEWKRASHPDDRVNAIRRQALAVAAVYRRVDEAWREARRHQLTEEILERSGAMTTDGFREGLLNAARTTGWDARRFIQELEERPVPRFGAQKLRKLREFLVEEGVLADGPVLTAADVRNIALAVAEAQVSAGMLDGLLARRVVERACAAILELE